MRVFMACYERNVEIVIVSAWNPVRGKAGMEQLREAEPYGVRRALAVRETEITNIVGMSGYASIVIFVFRWFSACRQ